MEDGSVYTSSKKPKDMQEQGKKSMDSSIWGEPMMDSNSNSTKTCIPDHYQSRDTVGTCLIVFALPLLIPGVTLTAVAFEDETGFSKYSVLHVLGMVMLVSAGIFILVGIALIFRVGYKVVPEYPKDHSPTLSTHGSNQLQSQAVLSSDESIGRKSQKERSRNTSVVFIPPMSPATASLDPTKTPGAINTTAPSTVPPSKIPLNFMIESGQGQTFDQLGQPPKGSSAGSLPPINAMQAELSNRLSGYSGQGYSGNGLDKYSSSSYDEYSDGMDSDENSSGSYIITGENEAFEYSDEERSHVPKPAQIKTSVTPRSGLTLNIPPSRNFFFEDNVTDNQNLSESTKMKRNNKVSPLMLQRSVPVPHESLKEETTAQTSLNPIQMIPERHLNDSNRPTQQQSPNPESPSIKTVQSPIGSPRQRLGAISNVSALASSLQINNNEIRLPEMSESNGSVFTSGEEMDPVSEGETKDTKRLSADDIICNKQYVPSPKRTFSFDVTTEDECVTQTSCITEASGNIARDRSQTNEDVISSPKLVSILRSPATYDSTNFERLQANDEEISPISSGQSSSNLVTSALFSPTTTIFSFMNISGNSSSNVNIGEGGNGDNRYLQGIDQERHLSEPVPLKAKKHATFNCEDGGNTIKVTYYD